MAQVCRSLCVVLVVAYALSQDHYIATCVSTWPEGADELTSYCIGCDHLEGGQRVQLGSIGGAGRNTHHATATDAQAQADTVLKQLNGVKLEPGDLHTATTDNTAVMPATCEILGIDQVPAAAAYCNVRTPMALQNGCFAHVLQLGVLAGLKVLAGGCCYACAQ